MAKRHLTHHHPLSQKQPIFQLVLLEHKDVYVKPSKSTARGNAWRGRQFPRPTSLAVQLLVTRWGCAKCEGVTTGGSSLAWQGLLVSGQPGGEEVSVNLCLLACSSALPKTSFQHCNFPRDLYSCWFEMLFGFLSWKGFDVGDEVSEHLTPALPHLLLLSVSTRGPFSCSCLEVSGSGEWFKARGPDPG